MLPLLIFNTTVYYVRRNDAGGFLDAELWHAIAHSLLLPVFFVHVVLTLYVYGLTRPRRTLRVFHIYFGYLTFVITMLSQAGFTHGLARDVCTALMYLAIVLHIGIGLRYGVARHTTVVPVRAFVAEPSRRTAA
jgi:hypothetical protein